MTSYITLMGADDVRSAGSTISQAAETISRTASSATGDLDRIARNTSGEIAQHLDRFEEIVGKFVAGVACLAEVLGMQAENQQRAHLNQGVAHDGIAFVRAAQRHGVAP